MATSRRFALIPDSISGRMQAVFDRLIMRTPAGRIEFFDLDDFPWIADIESRADDIRAELDTLLADVERLPNFQDIQEEQKSLTHDDLWKVVLFYAYGERFDENCRMCPRTVEAVDAIPDMVTAMFSVMLPDKHIPPHTGPWKGVLRYHLALRTPADESSAGIRVGTTTRHWENGRSMIFDDTFEHEAWNKSDEIRVVLFVDVVRPLPWYLDKPNRAFIAAIRRSPFIKRALAKSDAWQETLGAATSPDGRG